MGEKQNSRVENRGTISAERKAYREANKIKIAEQKKKYRQKNKEKINQKSKQYYYENIDKIKLRNLEKSNEIKNYQKEYRKLNSNDIKQYYKSYSSTHRETLNDLRKQYENEKLHTNPLYKLKKNIITSISLSIKKSGFKKLSRTEQILGCSFIEFKIYIESKFEAWMNWDNYGNPNDNLIELNKTWDIDHKIPLSSASCEADLIKLNHYTNLQPLCSYTNRYIKRDTKI